MSSGLSVVCFMLPPIGKTQARHLPGLRGYYRKAATDKRTIRTTGTPERVKSNLVGGIWSRGAGDPSVKPTGNIFQAATEASDSPAGGLAGAGGWLAGAGAAASSLATRSDN
jgi:hypothetical protein